MQIAYCRPVIPTQPRPLLPEMFRDQSSFQATIEAAAEQLGISATAVEKDYWVSQVLRILTDRFPLDFIFKGGTSLSKGYGMIERFSEDIDLLIIPGGKGRGAVDRLMKDIAASAGECLGSVPETVGSGHGKHRECRIEYPTSRMGNSAIETSVLLEMGVRGGPEPSEHVEMRMLLADALVAAGTNVSAYSDLRSFNVKVLHPGRTLLEKLYAIHAEAMRLSRDADATVKARMGRHFYDVSKLLGRDDVEEFLAESDTLDEILREIEEISIENFGAHEYQELRPDGGFRSSPVFEPSSDVSQRVRAVYESDMEELYFGSDPLPSWDDICRQVAASTV